MFLQVVCCVPQLVTPSQPNLFPPNPIALHVCPRSPILIRPLPAARGTHIHHGYWPTPESKATESKETAQINLIRLLLDTAQIADGAKVLDVGCGIGGTSRYLASTLGCTVTGITISTKQVEMATRLTKAEAAKEDPSLIDQKPDADGFLRVGKGLVKFIEMDAEKMGDAFASQSESFDAVWICEALSHFPNKELFFQNANKVLKAGGKLALADWFKAENLDEKRFADDIKPIEGECCGGSLRRGKSAHGGNWGLRGSSWIISFPECC